MGCVAGCRLSVCQRACGLDRRRAAGHHPGGRAKHSGEMSAQEIHSIIACDGRVVSRNFQIPPLTNAALFKRDGNMCLYCAKQLSDADLTRDHVVPVSRGGVDSWDNVVASCRRCNHFAVTGCLRKRAWS